MKFLEPLRTIETKPRTIIFLLILLYSLPYFVRMQLYPFVAFDMFSDVHTETVGTSYAPYVIDENKKILVNEEFNPWPIRRADIHNSVEAWVKKDIALERLASAAPRFMELTRKRTPALKCYGIMRFQWPLTAPLEQRKDLMTRDKFFEHCDDK